MVGLGAHAPSASPYPTVSKTLVKLHSKMTNDSTCTAQAPNINKESRDVQSDDCLWLVYKLNSSQSLLAMKKSR